jgi:microcin C transport system substrate-binding protein
VILDGDKAFDHFQKGDLSYFTVTSARRWAEDMEFDAMKKGWAHRKREFVEYPQGLYGLAMNLQRPIFQDKNFRKALQYAFDFQELNKNLMYGAYYRACSVFPGTPYANPDLVPYHFDPRKCREYLTAAGFTKRGRDGIFQRADGTRASVTLTYGQPDFTRHLTVMKQAYRKLGIEINLDPLESGTAFERTLKRDYEMAMVSYTAGFYPDPRQYFGMDYLNVADNNDIWAFGTARTDSLISIYENNMDEQKREEAMHELDRIIQDEAFYLPFWYAPFTRFCYWDDLRFPKTFWPRRYQVESDWQVFWVDPVRHQQLVAAMKANRPLGPEDTVVDVDPYGIKTRLERAYSANGAAQ